MRVLPVVRFSCDLRFVLVDIISVTVCDSRFEIRVLCSVHAVSRFCSETSFAIRLNILGLGFRV